MNGVKWEINQASRVYKRGGCNSRSPPLWSPIQDVENPSPSFIFEMKEYVEVCELTVEEALKYIGRG